MPSPRQGGPQALLRYPNFRVKRAAWRQPEKTLDAQPLDASPARGPLGSAALPKLSGKTGCVEAAG